MFPALLTGFASRLFGPGPDTRPCRREKAMAEAARPRNRLLDLLPHDERSDLV